MYNIWVAFEFLWKLDFTYVEYRLSTQYAFESATFCQSVYSIWDKWKKFPSKFKTSNLILFIILIYSKISHAYTRGIHTRNMAF